jgi:putative hemolysin
LVQNGSFKSMISIATTQRKLSRHRQPNIAAATLAGDSKYEVRIARSAGEVRSALKLRYEVFKVELAGIDPGTKPGLEFDEFDAKCRHLIVVERRSRRTVGTYRLNATDGATGPRGFYSYGEFRIEDLPSDVLSQGIEIGRACIAPDHRNTKVLFLLWSALAAHLVNSGKRYFFGCCSIFTTDREIGEKAFRQLAQDGHFHGKFRVSPRRELTYAHASKEDSSVERVKLPSLFEMYLKIGAKVCSPPILDKEFGTIDFFVIFDLQAANEKFRRMFFA